MISLTSKLSRPAKDIIAVSWKEGGRALERGRYIAERLASGCEQVRDIHDVKQLEHTFKVSWWTGFGEKSRNI